MGTYMASDIEQKSLKIDKKFTTKDSGQREEFDSGARRDIQDDKPRYDLIPPEPLKRLGFLYQRGAKKYGEHNWSKGMPCSRYLSSAMRHLEQARSGDKEEDHLAAVIWNVMAIIHFEDTAWNDLYDWTPKEPVKKKKRKKKKNA